MNFLLINSNENEAFAAIPGIKLVRTSEFEENSDNTRRKSPDKLINCLVKLRSEFDFSKIDAISVTVGPGSFTGIRVGLALAKGIAAGLDKKLIPINNFLLQYERIPEKKLYQKICILIPAKEPVRDSFGEYYYAVIERGRIKSSGSLKIDEIEKIIDKNTLTAGNFDNDSMQKHSYFTYLNLKNDTLNESDAMLSLTLKYFNDGMLFAPNKVEPVYIKEFQFKKI